MRKFCMCVCVLGRAIITFFQNILLALVFFVPFYVYILGGEMKNIVLVLPT